MVRRRIRRSPKFCRPARSFRWLPSRAPFATMV